eukprot:355243-Prorocentrum_minimum.AAC.1
MLRRPSFCHSSERMLPHPRWTSQLVLSASARSQDGGRMRGEKGEWVHNSNGDSNNSDGSGTSKMHERNVHDCSHHQSKPKRQKIPHGANGRE